MKNEDIYFFRSGKNTIQNDFFNPSKFFVGTVSSINKELEYLSIGDDGQIYDNAGNPLNLTEEQMEQFNNGESGRIVFDYDGIYDSSFYVRESHLSEDEKALISLRNPNF